MMTIGYNPFDEDFSSEDFHEYRATAISLREENLRLKNKLKEYQDKIEQGTLVDTESYFIVEENQWAGKNRFLVCQNAIQLAVCDFCETREEALEKIKELQE